MRRVTDNQFGFSMVGVLVAAAASMVIMLSLATIIHAQSKQIFRLEDQAAILDLEQRFKTIFSKPKTCLANLENKSVNANNEIPLSEIRGPNNQMIYKLSSPKKNHEGFIEFESLKVVNHSGGIGVNFNNRTEQQGAMLFVAEIKSKRSDVPVRDITFDVNVRIKDGLITSCSTDVEGMVPGTMRGCRRFTVNPVEPHHGNPNYYATEVYSCPQHFGRPTQGTSWVVMTANCLGGGRLMVNNVGKNSVQCVSVSGETIGQHLQTNPNTELNAICCEWVE